MAGKTTWGEPTTKKVVSVTPVTKDNEHQKDPKGNFKHTGKFEGDDKGYSVSTRDDKGSSWPVGQEVEFKPGTWTSDDGTYTMHFASLVKKDNPFQKRSFSQPKGLKEYKAEAAIASLGAAAHIIGIKEGTTEVDVPKYIIATYQAAEKLLNQIFSEKE